MPSLLISHTCKTSKKKSHYTDWTYPIIIIFHPLGLHVIPYKCLKSYIDLERFNKYLIDY